MKTFLNRGGEKREKVVTVLLWAAVAALAAATVYVYARDAGASEPAFAALEPGTGRGQAAVDLNTATIQELDDLPGIGPSLARRIVAYREKNGPFQSPEDVTDVPGIGPATYADMAPYIGGETGEADP